MNRIETPKEQKTNSRAFAELVNNQGCVVLDRDNRIPYLMNPYLSPQFVIGIAHQGSAMVEYDSTGMGIYRHYVSMLYPNHIIRAKDFSSDFSISVIVVSPAFFERLMMRSVYRDYYKTLECPQFELTESQYDILCSMLDVMRNISSSSYEGREEMMMHGLDVMISLINQFCNDSKNLNPKMTEGQRLFVRFYDLVVRNYKTSREVQFYANELCLSAKYFGSLIRAETGIGAGDWIARYVVMQAKELLRDYPDSDIFDISQELGFEDQASFSRYFKRVEGVTPSEFRTSVRFNR